MIRKVVLMSVGMLVIGAAAAMAAFPPIDLTTLGATSTGSDGVIWSESITAPTGTGVYNPFLRVQASPTEQGFNTDFGGPADPNGSDKVPLDDVSGIWTRSIQLQNIGTVTVGGIDYYQFTLDINEPNGYPAAYLSLDQVQIYTVPDAHGNAALSTWAAVQSAGTLRYSMDTVGNDQEVYLDAGLQQGSGHDDMQMLIPVSKFTGAAATDYLYFYSSFGASGTTFDGTSSADGFEEWHALQGSTPPPPPPPVPEPTTLLLLGGGALGLVASRRRK